MPHPGPKGRCSVNIPQLILSIVDVAAAIFLIAVVLLQSGKSAGLSGAIAGVADTFMAKNRAKTWDAKLAKLTKWVAIGFVVITFGCRMRQNYGTIAADAAPVGGGTRSIPAGGPECGRKGTMI